MSFVQSLVVAYVSGTRGPYPLVQLLFRVWSSCMRTSFSRVHVPPLSSQHTCLGRIFSNKPYMQVASIDLCARLRCSCQICRMF